MKIAYVRVSAVDQNEERQVEALQKHGIDKWFREKVSAKDMERPQLKAMFKFVREGDTIYIHDLSRLARSTKDLQRNCTQFLDIVEELTEKKVHLFSNKESIDTSTPHGKMMLTMIGAIYEFERTNLLERQKEGIAIAKRNGRYTGRKEVDIRDFGAYYERYQNRELTKSALAEELQVFRPTLDKLIAKYEAGKDWKR